MTALRDARRFLARFAALALFLLVAACSRAPDDLERLGKTAQAVISSFSATLSVAKTFTRPNASWPDGQNSTSFVAGSTVSNYAVSPFNVTVTGSYDVRVSGGTLPSNVDCPNGNDTILYLYSGTFNPASPLTNLLVANDNVALPSDCKSAINSWALTAGSSYVLVVTTYYAGEAGNVDYTITGPGIAAPATAASLGIAGVPPSSTACVQQSVTVTARDSADSVAAGYIGTVHFTSSDAQAVLPGDYTFVGGDAGTKTFNVTLRTAGTQSLTVTDTTYNFTASQTGRDIVAGAAATVTATGGTPQSAPISVAFASPLAVHVVDACGTGNAVSGATVAYTAPVGGATAGLSSASTTTSASGDASITATAGSTTGSYDVTATVGALTPVPFTLTNVGGAPATVAVVSGSTQSATIGAPFGSALTVRVTDAGSNNLSGVTVTFTPPGGGAGATLSSTTAVTDVNGLASVTATANGVTGAYTVVASTGSATTGGFALTNTAGAAASLTAGSGGGQSVTVGSTFSSPLTAHVADALGNAVPGVTVTFAAPPTGPRASPSAASAVTDVNGNASISALAGTVAGAFAITASVTSLADATFALTNIADVAHTLALASGSPQTAQLSTAFGAALVARVTDTYGNAVGGSTVSFSAPGSGARATLSAASAVTDATGAASVTATAGAVSGSYAVTATLASVGSVSFALTNGAGAPSTMTVSAGSPQSAVAGAVFATALTVHVRDVGANDVAGVTVSFAAPGSGAAASLSAATAVTNASGLASITATAGTVAGLYDVTATLGGLSAAFSLTNTAGPAASITATSGSGQHAVVGTAFATPLTVLIADAHGNAVASAPLVFTAPSAGTGALFGATTLITAFTDGTGHASISASASTTTGSYTVTASAGALTPATFALVNDAGPPAAVALVSGGAQQTTVGTAFASPLVVRLTDTHGNPISGASVGFAAPSSGATASLTTSTATTDSSGRASVSASAGNVAGSFGVTASSAGVASISIPLVDTAGAASSVALVSGSGQTQVVTSAYPAPLVVLVRDAHQNPVPDAAVTFTSPTSGASATLANGGTSTTDSGGHASMTLTANTLPGGFSVGVSVAGAPSPDSFLLTNTAGAAASLTVVSGSAQSTTVGHAFAAALEVEVRDSSGNAVPSAVVSFTSSITPARGALSASLVASSALGRATTSVLANTVAGAFSVTASVAGAAPVSFALTNRPDVPAVIVPVASSTPQSAQVRTAFAVPLAVRVADAFGNVVPQAVVQFIAPLGSAAASATLDAATATTDSSGIASVHATATPIAGAYTAHASVASTASSADFQLTNLAGAASIITASAGDAQSATVHTAFATTLGVVLRDADGNAVPNALVTFHAPASGPTGVLGASSATTDGAGHAAVALTAGDLAGAYVVTATAPGAASPATFALTNRAGAASTVTPAVEASPQSAQVGSPYGHALDVMVRDTYGNAVSAATVTYAIGGSGATGALDSATATTSDSGAASVHIDAGQIAGTFSVTASVTGATTTARFDLTNLAAAASTLTAFAGASQTATVGARFGGPLVALVRDAYGNPAPGAVVHFAAPIAGARAAVSASAITDASGKAQTFADAGSVAGAYEIVATVDGATSPVRFALTNAAGAAARITALAASTPQSAEVRHAFEAALGVTVTDAFGNRVRGAIVHFLQSASGASATLSTLAASTGPDGAASVLAVAGTEAGTYVVSAHVDGVQTDAAFALANAAGPPSKLTLSSGGGQHATATTAFGAPLVFLVRDADGNAAPGVRVVLTLPSSGPSATTPVISLASDEAGMATFALHAGALPGTFAAAAAADGASAPVSVPLAVDAIGTHVTATTTRSDLRVDVQVPLTITVTGDVGTPSGRVRVLSDGTTELASFALEGGTRSGTVQLRGLGDHQLEVVYDAQGAYGASRSAPLTLHANKDAGHIGGGGSSCAVGAPGASGRTSSFALLAAFAVGIVLSCRRRRAAAALAAVVACAGLGERTASAQSAGGLAIDRFHAASPDSQWFALDSLSFRGHLEPSAGVVGDYAHAPLVFYGADGETRSTVVRHAPMLHAGASLTVYDRLRFAVVAPFSPFQSGDGGMFNGTAVGSPGGGVGDVAAAADVRVLGAADAPLRVALGAKVTFPTGSRSDMLGDGTAGFEPRAAMAGELGPFVYAVQGSVLLREPVAIAGVRFGNELRMMASAGVRFAAGRVVVGPELLAATPLSSSEPDLLAQTAAEVDLGAHLQATRSLRIGAGAGTGIRSALGTPDARVLFSVAWTMESLAPRPTTPAEGPSAPGPAPAPPIEEASAPATASAASDPGAETARPVEPEAPPSVKAAPAYRMLDERVYFAFDRSDLSPGELRALESVRAILAAHPERRARVEGHTDDVGTDDYNAKLSAARARRVIDWLIRHGIEEKRLEVVGLGASQPGGAARPQNRRVEFRVEVYE